MNLHLNVGFHLKGFVRVEKGSKSRPDDIETMEFENIVLNVGYEHLMSRVWDIGGYYPRYLYLGTGTTEPKATDLGLENISPTLPGKYSSWIEAHTGNIEERWGAKTYRFDWGEGEAEGTWTEMGLAYGDTYTQPFNRALFRNETGTPVSITVLPDEWLRIFVELRMYIDFEDVDLPFNVNGVPCLAAATYSPAGEVCLSDLWDDMLPSCYYLYSRRFDEQCNGAVSSLTTGLPATFDHENNIVTFTIEVDPGEARAYTFFRLCNGYNCRVITISNFRFADGTPFFRRCWDNAIIKEVDESLTASLGFQWVRGCVEQSSGTATGGTATALADTSKAWTVNEYQFRRIKITGGTGAGQERRIASNTVDTITVEAAWDTVPDNTSIYRVCLNG